MTIEEFCLLDAENQCTIVNSQIEKNGKKGFKDDTITFTLAQAKKAMKPEIKEVNNQFLSKRQLIEMMEAEEKANEDPVQLSEEEITNLKTLLADGRLEILLQITEKYNYIQSYILKADTGIKIAKSEGTFKNTSIRVYPETWELWHNFCKRNSMYSAADLLNTALLEYISRH